MFNETGSQSGKTSVKMVVVVAIIVVAGIFLLQNSAVVEIMFLFWKISMSRILLLLGAITLGFIAGFFVGWEVFSSRR